MNHNFLIVRIALLPACLTLLATSCLVAQEDPFGTSSNPFDSETNEQSPEARETTPLDMTRIGIRREDPMVLAIKSSNPSTPIQLIATIDKLMNIDRDELAKEYLTSLVLIDLTDQQKFELYKEAGSAIIFRIANRDSLQPDAAQFSNSILDGAERYANDSTRIDQIVDSAIRNEDKYQRSLSLSELKVLGDRGAAMLIDKLGDENFKTYWPRIRQAVLLFGDAAEGPLFGVLHSNSMKMRVEATYLLGHLESNESIEALLGTYHSPKSLPIQKEISGKAINRKLGKIPDQAASEERLYRSASNHLMDRVIIGSGKDDLIPWWRWDSANRTLVSNKLTARNVSRIRSFRKSDDLLEMSPNRFDFQRIYWLARLETAKLTAGVNQPIPASMLDTFAKEITPQLANQVLNDSLQLGRIPAAVASCEVMGTMKDPSFLRTENGAYSPLARAINGGSIRLMQAACNAIYEINPVESFSGSSDYQSALLYLSRSSGTRTALTVHPSLEIAQSIAAATARSGYSAFATTSAQELFDEARNDPDLALIVVTDRITQPDYSTLVQTLRASSRTKHIPILLMVSPDHLTQAYDIADRFENILVTPAVVNDRIIARQITNLVAGLDYQDATQEERTKFSLEALEHLANYASRSETYPFFDLASYERLLKPGLRSNISLANTCKVLAELGTADAQQSLLETAGNLQLPVQLRQVAVNAFQTAVNKRGIMLSRQQILDQYERYNTSENESVETQQILGAVLDALESRTKSDLGSTDN